VIQDPEETLRAYVSAFEKLVPEPICAFYHLPCMFIVPTGVLAASDASAAHTIASLLIQHARSQGYRRTEIHDISTRSLASNLAAVTGVFVRFNANDEEIGRLGFTYTMRQTPAGWRIVVAMVHDAPGGSPDKPLDQT